MDLVSDEFIFKFEILLKLLPEVIFARLASSVMKALQPQVQVSKTYL